MSEFTKTIIVDYTSPELVTNGSFGQDTDWDKGENWTITLGMAICSNPSVDSSISQQINLTIDEYYTLQYEITYSQASSGILSLKGSFDQALDSAIGSHSVYVKCINSNNLLSLTVFKDKLISLTNVSLKLCQLKKALEELSTTGGRIIVEQGEYSIAAPLDLYSNISISGGGNVVLKLTNSKKSVFNALNRSRIKIEGFKIIYDGPENEKLAMHPILMTNCSKCHLKNLTIISNNKPVLSEADNVVSAIYFYSPEMVIIEGCRIHDFGAVSSNEYFYGGGILLHTSSRCIIKNNIISQVGFTPILEIGSSMLTISNNIVFDIRARTAGIQVGTINSVVKGNIVDNIENKSGAIKTSHGYYSSGGKNSSVFGNIFNNNGFAPDSDFHSGVHLRYAGDGTIKTEFHALTGNICNSNSGNGIHAQDGTNYCSFFGNQCNENVLGICIQHEPPPAPDYPPENNCTVGNVAVNNTDPGVGDVDISVSEYNKQIVANNIGNLNL